MSTMIKRKELNYIYPYVSISIRMFLCISCFNCSDECLFLALLRVKIYLRSTLSNERLNELEILSVEAEIKNISIIM